MKTSRRAERIASLVQEEASKLVQFEFDAFSSLFVTITDVDVAPDLRNVKIFYSVFGGEEDRAKAANLFRQYASRFRFELGNAIPWRFVPEFTFAYDETAERADRIEMLLKEQKNEK